MDSEEFKLILTQAVSGDRNSIEKLLKFYEPMITRYSHIKSKVDLDLKQHIMLHIIKNITKFNLTYQ